MEIMCARKGTEGSNPSLSAEGPSYVAAPEASPMELTRLCLACPAPHSLCMKLLGPRMQAAVAVALLAAACASSSSDPTDGDDAASVEAAPFRPPTEASSPFLHDRVGAFVQGDADCDSPYWVGSTQCRLRSRYRPGPSSFPVGTGEPRVKSDAGGRRGVSSRRNSTTLNSTRATLPRSSGSS